jgi:hypothetical protein
MPQPDRAAAVGRLGVEGWVRRPCESHWSPAGRQSLAVTPRRSPDARLDLYKVRRYIHLVFWIMTRKLQQQYRFKGGICVRAFQN